MNITTRRFPRTLAEAFPDSLEASQARAQYGCAIQVYRGDSVHTRPWVGYVVYLGTAFTVGLLCGLVAQA